ncbi:MAG: TonB family protein [Deltaproteobacteria bacterium]|nr:TonB family protein [Deltaproteobacteria bacterium]
MTRQGVLSPRRSRRRGWWAVVLPFALLSLLAHLVLLGAADVMGWLDHEPGSRPYTPLSLVLLQPEVQREEEVEEPEPQRPDETGQIVDLPPPREEVRPDKADYLAEHDHTAEEETRTENTLVNPEVLAPQYSRESEVQLEELEDLQIVDPSSGARIGNDRFEPDRDGTLASLPSPWRLTNKDGLEAPVPSASAVSTLAGAPQNDLLDEKRGDAVNLNAREFLYASYLNRIRRQVNFYWEQNLDNISKSEPLVKPRYRTAVLAVLDADGALRDVRVTEGSGSSSLDQAVVSAFRLAGPFPNPPAGLVSEDGLVHLPEMSFTVVLGQAMNQFQGVDPRAGVQYPGLLKSPR